MIILKKLKSNKGGFKELIYDNIGIFIVIILIVVISFSMAKKTILIGNTVSTEQDNILTELNK